MLDEHDDDSVIEKITPEIFADYVNQKIIQGGMIPKLENAFEAIEAGVKQVVITHASEINGNKGTVVVK